MSIKDETMPEFETVIGKDGRKYHEYRRDVGSPNTGVWALQISAVFAVFAATLVLTMALEISSPPQDDKWMVTDTMLIMGVVGFVTGLVVVNYEVVTIESAAHDPLYGRLVRRPGAAPWLFVGLSVFPFSILVIMEYVMLITTGKDYV